MKRLEKLERTLRYLGDFTLPNLNNAPIQAVNGDDATGRLSKANGLQFIISIPECYETGEDTDTYRDQIVLMFFSLARVNNSARTPQAEAAAYATTLARLRDALDKLSRDTTGGQCSDMSGLSVTEATVTAEYSIFGGWSGWSMEVTLE